MAHPREDIKKKLGLTRMELKNVPIDSSARIANIVNDNARTIGVINEHPKLAKRLGLHRALFQSEINRKRVAAIWQRVIDTIITLETKPTGNNYGLSQDADSDSMVTKVTLESIASAYSKD